MPGNRQDGICSIPEMRGYHFLISASYPYPLTTIRIHILSIHDVNCSPYPIRIRSIDCDSQKFPPTFPTVASTLVVRFQYPPLAFGIDVGIAYFLMFATGHSH